jgi:hypothetical protein
VVNKKALDLLDKIERAADMAVNAKARALQYAGYETGRKAGARFEHWEFKRAELIEQLRTMLQEG